MGFNVQPTLHGRANQLIGQRRSFAAVLAALERANATAEVNATKQLLSAPRKLSRLGYSGAVDGAPSASARTAIGRYLENWSERVQHDVDISDAFIAELQKRTGTVCPLVCPPGRIADGERCVTTTARQKGKRSIVDTGNRGRADKSAPRTEDRGTSSTVRPGIAIGVGFQQRGPKLQRVGRGR